MGTDSNDNPSQAPHQIAGDITISSWQSRQGVNRQYPRPTADQYARFFYGNKDGPMILEDLVVRFSGRVKLDGGIDGITKTYHNLGARSVVDFILQMSNQANGAYDNDDR